MNSVLLHGIRRPNAVVLSSTSFYARAVRLQSSEPEQVGEEELHTIAGGHPGAFSSDDVPPPQPSQRNSDASAYRANGNATPRLPWENVASKLPPKANGNHGNLEALSRSRAAGGSLGTAASAQFPWDTVGSTQRTPVSKLNGNSSAPRVLAREGEIAAVYSRDLPRQGSQKPPVSQGLSLHSQRQNNSNSQNNSQAEARLPWERMLDVLPPKSQAGANGLAQSKANTERIQPSKLEGLANGFGRPVPKAERSLNGSTLSVNGSRLQPQDARLSANRTHESTHEKWDRRSESASQLSSKPKPRPATNGSAANGSAGGGAAMPWMLPAKQDSADVQKQREALDKMMAGGRYGGSHASHRGEQGASRKRREVKVVSKEVQIPAVPVPVRELAMAMSKKASDVVSMLRQMGEGRVSPSSMVEPDIGHMVAKEFGLRTKLLKLRDSHLSRTTVTEASFDSLTPRPPVVSVMGHVDHGKTTLLDALRTSKVAGTESAGITQKIGAFAVDVKDTSVTFFDTPGHAAFKSMRHATSRLTDIVIVVVAADDGVKSQTIEVFKLLKEFPNLAPVVAVTKVDRYGVDAGKAVEKISRQLLEHEIITEGYGGEVPIVPVSAVTQEGMDDLLETLVLQAEMLELRADGETAAEGVVVDSAIVKGKGAVADILVTWGRLKPRDVVVAGTEYGKVRMLMSSCGKTVPDACAAQPVRIVGMKGLPRMGDEVLVVESETEARVIVAERLKQQQLKQLEEQAESLGDKRLSEQAVKRLKDAAQAAVRRREKALYESREAVRTMKSRRDDSSKAAAKAAEEWASKAMKEAEEAIKRAEAHDDDEDDGPAKCFAIFKAEGFGMLEAMSQVITEVPQEEVELTLVRAELGAVTQSDVEAAALAEAPIFAFNVGNVPPEVKAMAQKEGVQIYSHDVIYRFLDDVKTVMSEFLRVEVKETVLGEAKTLQVFETTGKNKERVMVAGLTVSSGKLSRTHLFRVLRDDVVVAEGSKAASMRRHKDRVSEVTKDKECGVALEDFNDFQEGDVLQCYKVDEVKRQL